jgi:general secretion pathway protein A
VKTVISYFRLQGYPFMKNIPVTKLRLSGSQMEGLMMMERVLVSKEIGLLIGESGTGKSLILESLAKKLPQNVYRILHLPDPQGSARYIWRHLVRQLGIDRPGPDAFRELHRQLILFHQEAGRQPVLLIDEAHHLRPETIEQLRLLTNTTLDNLCPLILIMAGQPELSGHLQNPSYEAFNQRVGSRYRLLPMSEQETHAYIDHHLQLVGAQETIFTDEAKQAVFNCTRGIPRRVNQLCLAAMNCACLRGLTTIGPDLVNQGIEELIEV